MCGIAGKLRFSPDAQVQPDEIEAMLGPIAHRGPDGQGIHIDGPVGLGHCRLAIIDVDGGPQPMCNEDGSVWIVFNGEIYNFQPLREELLARGHRFKSRSDTEVILHLYEEYGVGCLKHLRGMFGFAIWDARRRRLFVARDRVGIKPIYYSQAPNALYFASELKAIIADKAVARDVDLLAFRNFYSFTYVPGETTPFQAIRKLLPGHFLIAEEGRVSITRYWDLKFNRTRAGHSFDDVVEELYELLGTTVRDHMMADVPVGVLLSGGVDSSAVTSFAVRSTSKKVHSFTVGFGDSAVVDERPYARLAAARFGTDHNEITVTPDDFWNFLPKYVWHMEEPVCEPPAVALYYISKLARSHVKVLLSGEGGDEAFAGYSTYPNVLRLERLSSRLGPFARPLGRALTKFAGLLGSERWKRQTSVLGHTLAEHYFSRSSGPTGYFNAGASEIFTSDFLAATSKPSASAIIASILRPAKNWPSLDQMLYADTKTWLPDDLLVKADKMTMASSLELRVPLLDHVILEFAASLNPEHKVRGRETKRALKAAFTRTVPEAILSRKKAGFPVPYSEWLRYPLASQVRDTLLSSDCRARGLFKPQAVERLLKIHRESGTRAKEIFSMLVTELWYLQFQPKHTALL